MIYRPDAELSATDVIDILLNPKDQSQVLWKRINQLASDMAKNAVDREDLVSTGYLYCAEVISEKWLQIPDGDGEPIITLSQMVRYLTAGMYLEKAMRIASQNLSTPVEIKDNYNLYLDQKKDKEGLDNAGLGKATQFEPTQGNEAEAWSKLHEQTGSDGRTPSGYKIYEADDFTQKIIDKVSYERSYKLFLPKLTEPEIMLYEQIIELDLSYEEIAAIDGDTSTNTIAKRWQRLRTKIRGILYEYEQHPHRIPREAAPKSKPTKVKKLIKTELIKVAIKHGILSLEVEQMLGRRK